MTASRANDMFEPMGTSHIRIKYTLLLLPALFAIAANLFLPDVCFAAGGIQQEPFQTSRFVVMYEAQAVPVAEISGLASESQVLDGKPGGLKRVEIVLGRRVLSQQEHDRDPLWMWRAAIINGRDERHNLTIDIVTPDGSRGRRFYVINAWPHKWAWPALDGDSPKAAMEHIYLIADTVLTDGGPAIRLPKMPSQPDKSSADSQPGASPLITPTFPLERK